MPEKASNESRRYVLIMPCRDEEVFIEQFVDCVARQTILPERLMIVNDGSTDRTAELAEQTAQEHPWIRVLHRHNRGERKLGGGVIDAFDDGYRALDVDDFDYVCKIDADMTFSERYFEALMEKFEQDPKLGGASGKVFRPEGERLVEEFIIDEMVAGQVNFWRRECFEDIGGYVAEVMWDGIVWHKARLHGWKSRSFRDDELKLYHHRLMGSSHRNVYHGRLRWGKGQWFMGSHPLYITASGVFRMREKPYLVGGLLIIAGYAQGWLQNLPRYEDPAFRAELRRWQREKLRGLITGKGY